ncbi:hypothetical protein QR305_02808 [Bacteroides finegoldii]|jgi:hypothetical protein|uniref:Uncharacterized protein n=1 Tax=Bacteroides finegoldii CL09T03C10 TaxID=997888 RepID=K5CT05_9BACE|nr:hypothetical protein [Bacteroides finegoldii]EKJ92550.1 hypothetical protein HMPREF1057_01385 [Bacteroides finegoldii CL09T03C10]
MFGLEFVAGRFVKATLKSAANQVLSDKIARTVKRHALCASLVMILPTFGLDSFLFIGVLWHMYSKICDLVNIPFWEHFVSTCLIAILVNFAFAFVASMVLSFIPLGDSLLAFVQIMLSGIAYMKALTMKYDLKAE